MDEEEHKIAVKASVVNCFSKQSTCAITNDTISDMEPHIKLFGRIRISKGAAENILNDSNFFFERIQSEESTGCNICSSESVSSTLIKKNNKPLSTVCDDCFEKVLEEIENIVQAIEDNYIYYHNSGFLVRFGDDERIVYKHKSGELDKTNFYIIIGFDETSGGSAYVYISNLGHFSEYIRNISPSKEGERCDFCEEKGVKYQYNIKKEEHCSNDREKVIACKSCKNNIIEGIEEFIEENKKLLTSRSI